MRGVQNQCFLVGCVNNTALILQFSAHTGLIRMRPFLTVMQVGKDSFLWVNSGST